MSETASLAPTEAEIITALPASSVINGRAYVRSGRVMSVSASPDFGRIEASVSGSARHPYRQTIRLTRHQNGALKVAGQCTCPMFSNCKHVAAALLSAVAPAGLPTIPMPPTRSRTPGRPQSAPAPALPPAPAPMPYGVASWLEGLARAGQDDGLDYPDDVRQRLFYVLGLDTDARAAPALAVRCFTVRMLKSGVLSEHAAKFSVMPDLGHAPGYLRVADRGILPALAALPMGGPYEAGPEFIETLTRIVATGRARWGAMSGPALELGPRVDARIEWKVDADGTQTAGLVLETGLIGLALAEPWYADPATGRLGPLGLDMPVHLAGRILRAPPIPADHVNQVAEQVARLAPHASPRILPPEIEVSGPPTPVLRLILGSLPYDPRSPRGRAEFGWSTPRTPVAMARLEFRYGPVTVPAFAARTMVVQDGTPYRIRRHRAAEARAADRLGGLLLMRADKLFGQFRNDIHAGDFLLADIDGEDWIELQLTDLPEMIQEGWEVITEANFPYRLARADSEISVRFGDGDASGIDWLELDVGVMVDGQRVDLVPALLKMLGGSGEDGDAATGATLLVRLPDGRLLPLPVARVRPIAEALLDLFARPSGTSSRVGRLDVAALAALELASAAAGAAVQVGQAAARMLVLGRMLRNTDGIPSVDVPPGFRAELRPYQARGLDWLQFLREAGLGGVLADDMGLGKTVQTLAHLLIEQQAGRLTRPALIVCPTSLVANWRMEAERFAPGLRTLALHGPTRAQHFGSIAAHDLVITTYPLLTRDRAVLMSQEWQIVVLDEAQTVKNPSADAAKLVRQLRAEQRLCLSGTPLENHLGELWSLFDFAVPGLLGDREYFRRTYRTPIEKGYDDSRRLALASRVRPFLLRRTKQEVERDLPPKTEIIEAVEMGPDQRAVYETIRMAMHDRVRAAIAERGLARSGIVILDALLKLRQACCDPRLLKLQSLKARKPASAKFDRLMEMLPELLEEGRSILLFSQFTEMLGLIEASLQAEDVPYLLLTGDTRDRATPVRRFQAGETRLFLVSLKAGGTGLNLTAADTVIHYDPWWNPAVEDQATDRAHRIGQDKAVFVHKMITLGSIEEKMELLKARKRDLAAGILAAEIGGALTLRADDVDDLFAPVG